MVHLDLDGFAVRDLLRSYARILEELRARDVVKTANNPVADYAELLVSRALGLDRQPSSNKGFDAVDPSNGDRYEVKARRITAHNKASRLSPLRDFDSRHFEYLAVVLFAADFSVQKGVLLPWESVTSCSLHSKHVNGRLVVVGDALWKANGLRDITDLLQDAEKTI